MKDSFVLYNKYIEIFDQLSDEEAGKLFKAILEYVNTGNCRLEGTLKAVFVSIKQDIDYNSEKYEDTCNRNRENGSKGGRPRKDSDLETEENPKKPSGFSENRGVFSETQQNPLEPTKTLYEYDNDIYNIQPTDVGKPSKDEQALKDFELIWEEYPKKEGKSDAFKRYKAWLKGKPYLGKKVKLTNEQMWNAVQRYAEKVKNTEKEYIKQGRTFFGDSIMEFVEGADDG